MQNYKSVANTGVLGCFWWRREEDSVFTERKETLLFSLLNHGVPLGNKPHRSCILFIELQSSDQVTMKTSREQEVATFSVPGPITVVGVRKGHCKDANHWGGKLLKGICSFNSCHLTPISHADDWVSRKGDAEVQGEGVFMNHEPRPSERRWKKDEPRPRGLPGSCHATLRHASSASSLEPLFSCVESVLSLW